MYSNKVICKIRTIMTQRSECNKVPSVAPAPTRGMNDERHPLGRIFFWFIHYVWINALRSMGGDGGVGGGVGK